MTFRLPSSTYDRTARLLSFSGALVGALVLGPAIAAVAVAVRVGLGRPVLFHQQRSGRAGKTFMLVKFRTMRNATDDGGNALPDLQRLGKFGAVLRSLSLDELPQLWNVIKGDMNLVGPRPLVPEYLPLFDARQARRLEVRPGLTGWNAVNGRNQMTWEEQFEMDVWYVDNRSIVLDAKILAMTLVQVISRKGTMVREPFRGTTPNLAAGNASA